MAKYPDLYTLSRWDTQILGQMDAWEKSHAVNLDCRNAIQQALSTILTKEDFLPKCAQDVLDVYGLRRVRFVLASTMNAEKEWQFRFNRENSSWLQHIYAPCEECPEHMAAVAAPWPALNRFAAQVNKVYRELCLLGAEHCHPDEFNYMDRVLLLKPEVLAEENWRVSNMLWLACRGPGCSLYELPGPSFYSEGREVIARCLVTGEMARWHRTDFHGIVKDEFLPDWAVRQLEDLQNGWDNDLRGSIPDGPAMNFY